MTNSEKDLEIRASGKIQTVSQKNNWRVDWNGVEARQEKVLIRLLLTVGSTGRRFMKDQYDENLGPQ